MPVSFTFEGLSFDAAFRIDLVVAGRLLVEIKSVERLNAAHAKQLLTYLRLTDQPLGCLSISEARRSRRAATYRQRPRHLRVFASSREFNKDCEECSILAA